MRSGWVIVFYFLCIGYSTVQGQMPVAGLRADFDSLRKALEEAHGGLYRFSTKAEVNERFDSYRKQLETVSTRPQFISLLAEMLAGLRDGHLRLDFDETTTAAMSRASLFPLRLLIEGGRAMVLFNDTPGDSTIRPGMEILTINGQKVSALFSVLLPKISVDGFIETGKWRRLERSLAQSYWMVVDQTSEFTVTAKDAPGKIVTAVLPGVLNAERENNRKNNPVNRTIREAAEKLEGSTENISLRFISSSEIACLRIRLFGGQDFMSKLDSVFSVLKEKKTRALILDLRGNGGGVDNFGAYLVAQFMDKPFRYFDRIELPTIDPSFTKWPANTYEDLKKGTVKNPKGGYLVTSALHSGVGEQSAGKNPFQGKLYVLLDGLTFSTAADVTALLKHHNKAIFIGEECGGGFEGNTSGLNADVKLPNSGLRLRISLYDYWNAVSVKQKGRGTIPDHAVARRISDLLLCLDLPYEMAVKLAQVKQ